MDEKRLIAQLHVQYYDAMVQYAARMTGDLYLAEDLAQEAFTLALLRKEKLAGHENPAGRLFKTLHYLTLREMDRAYHKMETPIGEEALLRQGADGRERLSDVLPAEMTDDERELLILRFEQNVDYEELAELRGISAAACRKRVSRAMQRCRAALEKESAKGGVVNV